MSYKFLNFFRVKVKNCYGIQDRDFSKKYQTTLRHAFSFGALMIHRTMTASQLVMRETGDDIGEYMQKLRDKNEQMGIKGVR